MYVEEDREICNSISLLTHINIFTLWVIRSPNRSHLFPITFRSTRLHFFTWILADLSCRLRNGSTSGEEGRRSRWRKYDFFLNCSTSFCFIPHVDLSVVLHLIDWIVAFARDYWLRLCIDLHCDLGSSSVAHVFKWIWTIMNLITVEYLWIRFRY